MWSIIEQAIAQKCRLKLYYADYNCIVEPYAFGLDVDGQSLLLCFQIAPQDNARGSNNWCVIHPHDVVSIKMLDDGFDRIQSGYIRNHPAFHTVLIQV